MAIIELKGTALNYSAGLGAFDMLNTAWTSTMRSSTSLHEAIETLQLQINVAASFTSVGTAQDLVQKAEAKETEKQSALTLAYEKLDTLIMETAVVDQRVADVINTLQADFYKSYPYLEPDNWLEEFCGDIVNGWNSFWDGIGSAIAELAHDVCEWIEEHWQEFLKAVAVVVLVVASVLLLVFVPGGGLLSAILLGAAKGCLIGFATSVAINGAVNVYNGRGFWDGALDAAFSGAVGGFIGGGITGGLLGNGATMGKLATEGLLKTANSFWGAVGQGAFVGAISTAASSAGVAAVSYWIENGTLSGAGEYILLSAFSGALTGGILGGILSGVQFKILDAIKKYSGSAYKNINNSLRQLDTLDEANVTNVKYLHKGLQNQSLPEDMILYRGASTDALGSLKNISPDQLVGKEIIEKGFMSTSTLSSVANDTFSGNMQMIINAPKGAHGMDITGISIFGASESEVLFDYGQKMIITAAKQIDDVLKLIVDIKP